MDRFLNINIGCISLNIRSHRMAVTWKRFTRVTRNARAITGSLQYYTPDMVNIEVTFTVNGNINPGWKTVESL